MQQTKDTQSHNHNYTTPARNLLDLSAFHAWHEMPAEGETTWYLVGGISPLL